MSVPEFPEIVVILIADIYGIRSSRAELKESSAGW